MGTLSSTQLQVGENMKIILIFGVVLATTWEISFSDSALTTEDVGYLKILERLDYLEKQQENFQEQLKRSSREKRQADVTLDSLDKDVRTLKNDVSTSFK